MCTFPMYHLPIGIVCRFDRDLQNMLMNCCHCLHSCRTGLDICGHVSLFRHIFVPLKAVSYIWVLDVLVMSLRKMHCKYIRQMLIAHNWSSLDVISSEMSMINWSFSLCSCIWSISLRYIDPFLSWVHASSSWVRCCDVCKWVVFHLVLPVAVLSLDRDMTPIFVLVLTIHCYLETFLTVSLFFHVFGYVGACWYWSHLCVYWHVSLLLVFSIDFHFW